MRKIIDKEETFQVPTPDFAVQSSSAFTLNYSVNETDWKAYDEVTPAGEPLVVKNGVRGLFYKLVGNTDSKTILKY